MSLGYGEYFELASAVGTVAATVVALWLGLSARRNSRDEELRRARLCAALISVRLSATHEAIRAVALAAIFKDLTISDEAATIKGLQSICAAVLGNFYIPSHKELVELVPLENNCAHRIARASDYLEKVRGDANHVQQGGMFFEQFSLEGREKLLHHWSGMLFAASDLLEAALRECNAASELGAPMPSGQELHASD